MQYLPPASYPKANSAIDEAIQKFLVESQKINLENNTSVIRGALGEIYWTAFFEFIGVNSNSSRALPVGFDVRDIHGWEIPIDILFKKIGF